MKPAPGKRITFLTRLRYDIDNTLSRGPAGLIVWLAAISCLLVLGATLFVVAAGRDPDKSLGVILWDILYQTLTPNPVDPTSGSNTFLYTMLFSTIGNLFLVSVFIGILTNTIDNRIQNLRKGRSFVIEHNHTLILGWSPKIFVIISQLIIANENKKNPRIVILADKDKVEMEDEIRARVGHTRNTHVVCRTGSPIDLNDLDIANPQACKSIIILSPIDEDPDSQVIKTILSVINHPDRRAEPYHIVAEIREPKHMEIAGIVGQVETQLVLVSDLISRITVQTSRQSGLSVVYTELLNFEGDEIYFQSEPALAGKTYGEALLAYEDSAVMGLLASDGRVRLNPATDTRIGAGDQIIAISEDDDTVKLSGLAALNISTGAISESRPALKKPERTLILGWNAQSCQIISQIDAYVAPGSEVQVVADVVEAEALTTCLSGELHNLRVAYKVGDTTDRTLLEALDIQTFDHIIILSYSDVDDTQKADALTLVTLLHLRRIAERCGHRFSIVSEMMDVRNRRLAEVTRADDFIVSDMLTALMLAQVSENKHLMDVFAKLFDAAGTDIYLKPAAHYVLPGQPVNFYTVVESARRRGETAIGYRLRAHANDITKTYGVVINPEKSNLVTFDEQDRVIVLAES
ncbi:MAG: potassium transporter TrkA [Chloroflexi bacterium]|nr:potassium transporter TrkA [Chloroflexota bacterium]MCL5274114.1 potassium transporter TrkA [Chloroflexota bacterium]